MSKEESREYRDRLKEITSVLRKNGITRGLTPQKLRIILEELGPTYIKIGQIMSLHSDILPKRYCDELMKLCSDVAPMPFSEVREVVEQAYGCPWSEIFSEIDEKPLGSASIAQVHRALLLDGITMLNLLGESDLVARLLPLQRGLLDAVRNEPEANVSLGDYLSPDALTAAAQAYAARIQREIDSMKN